MENACRQTQYAIEAGNGFVKALKASEKHATIVVVGKDFDGLSSSLHFSHWLFNYAKTVLVALGFQTKFREAAVEASDLLRT